MRRKLPSIRALESFEAVFRHGNVTRAAEVLGRTQSAVSRQVANLEEFLGQDLFVRERKQLILNDTGKRYLDKIISLLDKLEEETVRLQQLVTEDNVLRLGVLPTLASRWLMPRLAGYLASGESTELHLVKGLGRIDFERQQVDAAIECAFTKPEDLVSHHLLDEYIVAVVSKEIYKDDAATEYSKLYMPARSNAWEMWEHLHPLPVTSSCVKFENYTMMIEAACLGFGVAVIPSLYVNHDLETGRLIAPFGKPVPSGRSYWLTYPESSRSKRKVIDFMTWLTRET
ncbi:MAG: LysR substrate-binding domain-containing protein [Pseudohongiellaceae bacterium]